MHEITCLTIQIHPLWCQRDIKIHPVYFFNPHSWILVNDSLVPGIPNKINVCLYSFTHNVRTFIQFDLADIMNSGFILVLWVTEVL